MEITFTKLDWDSDFFDFNVGRIYGEIQSEQDIKNIEGIIGDNNAKLTYYSSLEELPPFAFESDKFELTLVDRKTSYFKAINKNLSIHNSIKSLDSSTPFTDKLIELALQSGIYSRFNVDKKIGKEKYEELYSTWITKSLNRSFAKEVLVLLEDNELKGFVTLGEKNKRGDIGILAVDYRFRGNGYGRILMESAEKWFADKGYEVMQVVTQGDNVPACKLYERCGYNVETVEFFYHIWKK